MISDINIASIFTHTTIINDDNIHVNMYGVYVVTLLRKKTMIL